MRAKIKNVPTGYLHAYLLETVDKTTGEMESHVKLELSKTPFKPEQFTSLMMGIMEAYVQELLSTNSKEAIYDHFNNAFGIFLAKILPEDKIYERSEVHKKFKEIVDTTLGTEEDKVDTDNNRMAAYLLAGEILRDECHMDEDTVNLLLSKRLGLLSPAEKPVETVEKPKPVRTKRKTGEESAEKE